MTLTVGAGTADADTRDPCADLAHRATSNWDLSANYLAFGDVLLDLGFNELATEQYDMGAYFADAATVYLSDYGNMGC